MKIREVAIKKLIYGSIGASAVFLFALLLSFTVFAGRILDSSLTRGMENLRERLGADIAVVPKGAENSYQGIILSGEPVECSMDRKLEEELRAMEGVEEVTPVIYLASLNASCCSVPIQIIGYDPETDFVTSPWISEDYSLQLGGGDLIAGANIALDGDNTLTFFGRTYDVRARLNRTGTGMDKSVYVTFDVMEQMLADAREKGIEFGEGSDTGITDRYVSAFLIRVEEGADADLIAGKIMRNGEVGVVQSKNMLSSVTDGISLISKTLTVITWVMAVIVTLVTAILSVFRVNTRRKEWAVFRMMGASEGWILRLILLENIIMSFAGAVLGIILASLAVFPFSRMIADGIGLPYYGPGATEIIKVIVFSILITVFSGALPGIIAGAQAGKTDCYVLMRDGES